MHANFFCKFLINVKYKKKAKTIKSFNKIFQLCNFLQCTHQIREHRYIFSYKTEIKSN